jgi:hypothetical protein
MKRIRGKLTYANVMATVAVFIALGGASYAAIKLPKNSVGTNQIKKEAVTAAKLKNGTVTGTKIAAGTITGSNIDLSSLGTVPSAANATRAINAEHAGTADTARDAQTIGGKSATQLLAEAKPSCPAGTKLESGLCFEVAARPASAQYSAIFACQGAGGWLPNIEQVINFQIVNYTTPQPAEWTNYISFNGTKYFGMTARGTSGTKEFGADEYINSHPYRCVFSPTG